MQIMQIIMHTENISLRKVYLGNFHSISYIPIFFLYFPCVSEKDLTV